MRMDSSPVMSSPSPVKENSLSPLVDGRPSSTFDDLLRGVVGQDKQQLQEALVQLLKGNPQVLETVQKEMSPTGDVHSPNVHEQFPHGRIERQSAGHVSEGSRKTEGRLFPELNNKLNRPCVKSTSSGTDSDDDVWLDPCLRMSSRELYYWRKGLFSVFIGYLPYDISKRELVHLFGEIGNIRDIHVQPPEDSKSYTYGFVRFSTLEEVIDAVSEFNGKVLGNRAITVEMASETRSKLATADSEEHDAPLSARDKLLKRDYPRVQYRPMSANEAQERLIEWKLRQTTAKPETPHAAFVKDYMGHSTKDDAQGELIEKIEEIVKKLADVPPDTQANPSGDEGPALSQRILQDCQGGLGLSESRDRIPSSVHQGGDLVSQDQRPASVSPNHLSSSVQRRVNPVSQDQRPASVSPNRLPSSVERGTNPVSQDQRPASVSPNRLPSSVDRGMNPVSQDQRPASVSPNRLPSGVDRGMNPVSQDQIPAPVSPNRLPSSVQRGVNPVSQYQRPASMSPDHLPSSVQRGANPVSQDQRPASVSPSHLTSSVPHFPNPALLEQRSALVSLGCLPSNLDGGMNATKEGMPFPDFTDRQQSSVQHGGVCVEGRSSKEKMSYSESLHPPPSAQYAQVHALYPTSTVQHGEICVSEDVMPPLEFQSCGQSIIEHSTYCATEGRQASREPFGGQSVNVQHSALDHLTSSSDVPVQSSQHAAHHESQGSSSVCCTRVDAQVCGTAITKARPPEEQPAWNSAGMPPSALSHDEDQSTATLEERRGKANAGAVTDEYTSTDAVRASESLQHPKRSFCHELPLQPQRTQTERPSTGGNFCQPSRTTGVQQLPCEPRHDSEAVIPEVQSSGHGLCNGVTNIPQGPHPSKQGNGDRILQTSQVVGREFRPAPAPYPRPLLATPGPNIKFPFINQFQAPAIFDAYLRHQFNINQQNQRFLAGLPGGSFPQRFYIPPPRPEFNVPRFGKPGAFHTWPRDMTPFPQPSRFRHIHSSPCKVSSPGESPVLIPHLTAATRGFPVEPRGRDVGGRLLVNEFGSPVVSDRIAPKQLQEDNAPSLESYPGIQTRGNVMMGSGQTTLECTTENVKIGESQWMNALDDFDSPVVSKSTINSTQLEMMDKESSEKNSSAEAHGSVTLLSGHKEAEQTGLGREGQEVLSQGENSLNELGSFPVVQGQPLEVSGDDNTPAIKVATKRSTRKAHDSVAIATRVNSNETDMGYKSISSNDEGSNLNGKTTAESAANDKNQRVCKQDSGIHSPGSDAAARSLGTKDASLLQLKMELERILAENKKLRVEQGDRKKVSGKMCGMYSHEAINAVEEEIHAKEIQLQREKEIICARYSEQELLYEREKLAVAFDHGMMKELETERATGETRNALSLAKIEQDLLVLYRKLISLS